MIQDYEENIIQPPFKFIDKLPKIIEEKEPPIPAPRTKKQIKKPTPLPRTIINETNKALISIKNNNDPKFILKKVLNEMKGLKFIETLKITFEKQTGHKKQNKTIKSVYFNSIAQPIIINNWRNKNIMYWLKTLINFFLMKRSTKNESIFVCNVYNASALRVWS